MRAACTWTNLNQEGSGVPWTNPIRMANPTSEESRSQLNPVIRKVSGRQAETTHAVLFLTGCWKSCRAQEFRWSATCDATGEYSRRMLKKVVQQGRSR